LRLRIRARRGADPQPEVVGEEGVLDGAGRELGGVDPDPDHGAEGQPARAHEVEDGEARSVRGAADLLAVERRLRIRAATGAPVPVKGEAAAEERLLLALTLG